MLYLCMEQLFLCNKQLHHFCEIQTCGIVIMVTTCYMNIIHEKPPEGTWALNPPNLLLNNATVAWQ